MKFRDPKTGEVFEDIEKALKEACKCNECKGWAYCTVGYEIMRDKSCHEYAAMNPCQAARLMGYEVIEEKEDKPMDKPLKDWTLGEVIEHCKQQGDVCAGCEFYSMDGCEFAIGEPTEWELIHPRFTPEEVERAKALKQFDPLVNSLYRLGDFVCGAVDTRPVFRMSGAYFPTVEDGEIVKISDIIGGEHERES